jgi:hypothetical protein
MIPETVVKRRYRTSLKERLVQCPDCGDFVLREVIENRDGNCFKQNETL